MIRKLPWEVVEGAKRRRLDFGPELCVECSTLNFETSLQHAFDYYRSARAGVINRRAGLSGDRDGILYYEDAFLVHRFHNRLSRESQCALCRFFWGLRVEAGAYENYKLLAFCSSENALFCLSRLKLEEPWETMDHTVFLAVVPDIAPIPLDGHEEHWLVRDIPHVGSIHLVDQAPRPGILQVRELGKTVDFSVPREWLSYCRKHHVTCHDQTGANGAITHGFRAIDCYEDPPIVKLQSWGVKFAALSYVWGEGVVEDWPATVLDAVSVTRELGLQHLWVDRLCIDQENAAEKHYLIQRMATIYEGAEITIIGAAGSGAAHGLPGVRSTPRKPQPSFNLATGGKLVSTLQDPRIEIVGSEWATRGWTYQEGALSNRRLVFTDHQVYWECLCMATYESIILPLDQVHLKYGSGKDVRMGQFMLSGIFHVGSGKQESVGANSALHMPKHGTALGYGWWNPAKATVMDHLIELDEHIRSFSARTLRYDEDSLSAFLGIARQRRPTPELVVFLGLPMWVGRMAERRHGAQVSFAVSVCSWSHKSWPGSGHFVSEDCRRRKHLPSWTWAGWKGTVTWQAPPTDRHHGLLDVLVNSTDLGLVYVPDTYLEDVQNSTSLRLSNVNAPSTLENQFLRVIKVRDPIMLRKFHPQAQPTEKQWEWRDKAGPAHSESRSHGRRSDFDEQWYRLDRRLVSIATSVPMTMKEWSDKHSAGELVSVLMYAGRVPDTHVRARFLTIRRAPACPGSALRWERVGSLQLTMHRGEFAIYRSLAEFLAKLPVQAYRGDILIE
ncbi:HET-domain-containing protein [Paramyrothecium foliicola]|nr:HET-domain-containing protein [Paramyrothecium foliicola]